MAFNFDVTSATASIEVLPKDDYEVQVGEPKTFQRTNSKGQDSYGILFPMTVKGGIKDGKKVFYNAYLHTDGGEAYTKQFLLAAYGFARNAAAEKAFNEEYGAADWSFDPTTNHIGQAWRNIMGRRLVVSLDEQPNRDRPDEKMQQFTGFRPVDTDATDLS